MLAGELTLVVEGEDHVLGEGELARVAPQVRRQLANRRSERVDVLAVGGYGEHESRDARAWTNWEEDGPGRSPGDVPLPEDV